MTAAIYPFDRTSSQSSVRRAHAWIDVDLDAIRHNAALLHACAGVPMIVMIKADGYGLGAAPVVRALAGASRSGQAGLGASAVWAYGVATVEEARALRAAGYAGRLWCGTPLLAEELRDAATVGLTPALHTASNIAAWRTIGRSPWHLAIDTGMSRAGVRWDEVVPLRSSLSEHPPEGVFTHFHSADEPDESMALQDARFAASLLSLGAALPASCIVHSDNSAAISRRGAGSAGLVRPGIGVFGALARTPLPLLQPVHLRARIVDLRDLRVGETVGYGGSWTATVPSRIATVPVGYADGYRRHLSNIGCGVLHGVRCAVAGRVSMDMTMLDVTNVPCELGDVVTMLGTSGEVTLTTQQVAAEASVSPYELLTGLRQRLPRHYLGDV